MSKFLIGLVVGVIVTLPVGVFAGTRVYDQTRMVDDRFDDPDFQVKCWWEKRGYGGGLSCLPWSEVKERED